MMVEAFNATDVPNISDICSYFSSSKYFILKPTAVFSEG
jgi:hypothetical protein